MVACVWVMDGAGAMQEDVGAEVAMVAAAAEGTAGSDISGSDASGWLAWV
ncbi:MAG: hypothetical protein ACK5VN_16460 [Phycisphaerae bacterium]